MTEIKILPTDWAVAGLLAVAALWLPLPLYLVALSCFGLPHVLWELRWVRGRTVGALPRWWWGGLATVLAVQAGGRLATVLGELGGVVSGIFDLLCLAAALALVLTLPGMRRGGVRAIAARLIALAGAALLAWVGIDGRLETVVTMLIALSVAHNFTPIGLERLAARQGQPWSGLGFMMALPLVLLALPALPAPTIAGVAGTWAPAEFQWLKGALGHSIPNLLPALVLAQCLHYLAILRILPRWTGSVRSDRGWWWPAIGISAVLTLGFLWSFPEARKVYGIVAGLHAWLEWPILLCLLGGVLGNERSPT